MELGIHDVFTGIADDTDIAAFWRVSFSDEWKADDNGRAGDNDVFIGIGDDRHSYVLTSFFDEFENVTYILNIQQKTNKKWRQADV